MPKSPPWKPSAATQHGGCQATVRFAEMQEVIVSIKNAIM